MTRMEGLFKNTELVSWVISLLCLKGDFFLGICTESLLGRGVHLRPPGHGTQSPGSSATSNLKVRFDPWSGQQGELGERGEVS